MQLIHVNRGPQPLKGYIVNSENPTSGRHQPIVFDGPGELIAAIPHILGFHPVQSLIVVGWTADTPAQIIMTARVALPDPASQRNTAWQLRNMMILQSVTRVSLIVIDGDGSSQNVPHRGLVDECCALFAQAGVAVAEQVWTATTTQAGTWQCYEHDGCVGDVPDPRSTVLAAERVHAGLVTHDRREDLAATLAAAADEVLARRAGLLTSRQVTGDGLTGDQRLELVEAALDRAVVGTLPDSDVEFVQLAFALADHRVRDAFVGIEDADRRIAAERLWTCLVRGLPGTDRAEPASMLAFSAYARGDGVLAAIALEYAQAADPDHGLAGLLQKTLSIGTESAKIRAAGEQAAARARAQLSDD
jgi:hypothetical protein